MKISLPETYYPYSDSLISVHQTLMSLAISVPTKHGLHLIHTILKDYIFVEPGATLTIEAGTTIKADVGTDDSAPALIVTQGTKINAADTAANPIIFTSVSDTGSNLGKDDKGLLGGLIILGNARINSNEGSNADNTLLTNTIEGVPTTSRISGRSIPASCVQYGGTNAADGSGVLQFVSIRHGSAEIGSGN